MMRGLKKLSIVMATLAVLALGVGTAFAIPITNGDFESGNTGFSSSYDYFIVPGTPATGYTSSPPTPESLYDEKTYGVGTNPALYHGSWASFGAYEGSNMMIVNGSTDIGTNVWSSPPGLGTYPVLMNTTYYFSAWLASVYPDTGDPPIAPATLAFSADGNASGVQIGLDFTLSAVVGSWEQFYYPWDSGTNTSVQLSLINRNTDVDGNDFAMDAVSFDTTPIPEPGTLILLGSGLLGLVVVGRKKKFRG